MKSSQLLPDLRKFNRVLRDNLNCDVELVAGAEGGENSDQIRVPVHRELLLDYQFFRDSESQYVHTFPRLGEIKTYIHLLTPLHRRV